MSRQLVARGIAFAYPSTPDRLVLEKVNLAVAPGDRIGVVGENGSGKSTLLALLAGRLEPTRGRIVRRGSLAVVEQELDAGEETLGELVAASLEAARLAAAELEERLRAGDLREVSDAVERWEALRAWDADRVLDEALTRFGVPRDLDRQLSRFSVGERYRARLACRLAEQADLLLLDEPTNHLDAAALDHLTSVLETWRGAVVVVTHDRALLDDVATAILDLDPTVDGVPARYGASAGNGGVVTFSYAAYRRAKDAALARWRSRYHREQLRLTELYDERDRAYENLSDEWRPLKGSQKHRRGTRARQHVKNADRQHEKLMSVAVEVPPPPPELALPPLTTPTDDGAPVLSLTGAMVPGRRERPHLGVELGPGGRLLVVGPNGTGKSTLLGLLAAAGTPGVRVGLLAQEPSFGAEETRTAEELATARILAALAAGTVDPEALVPIAATGLVAEELLERPVAELSVGQRRRIDLALTLMTSPQVLVLDEPTNHLAVDLMDDLTAWLTQVGAAVVVATHDRRMRVDLGPDGADWPVLELD